MPEPVDTGFVALGILLAIGGFLLLAVSCDPYFAHELGDAILEGMRR